MTNQLPELTPTQIELENSIKQAAAHFCHGIIRHSSAIMKNYNRDGLTFWKTALIGPRDERYLLSLQHIDGPKFNDNLDGQYVTIKGERNTFKLPMLSKDEFILLEGLLERERDEEHKNVKVDQEYIEMLVVLIEKLYAYRLSQESNQTEELCLKEN